MAVDASAWAVFVVSVVLNPNGGMAHGVFNREGMGEKGTLAMIHDLGSGYDLL